MKINKIQILNLLSYEESELLPEQYNVIVGPNGSGKTNIIRILRFLAGRDATGNVINTDPLNGLDLALGVKTHPDQQSAIKIDFTLSDEEAWMLLQFILHDDTTTKFGKEIMKNVSLVIRWPKSLANSITPDLVFFQFANGLLIMNETRLAFLEKPVSKLSDLLATIYVISMVDSDIDSLFRRRTGYFPHQAIDQKSFQQAFVTGEIMNTFFYENNRWFSFDIDSKKVLVGYNTSFPAKYQKDVFEYCGSNKSLNVRVSLWDFARALLRNNIVFMSEVRPRYNELAHRLLTYKNSSELEHVYDSIKKRFSELFGGMKIEAFEESVFGTVGSPNKAYFIQVTENLKRFRLENAAAGYFEALYIFTEISTGNHGVVVLDEPALHLHPLKVKALGRILTKLSGNQVILVTHSPYFINADLFASGNNLILVQKNDSTSYIINKPVNFTLSLKPHHFNPEIFFCKASLLVEGSSDESAIKAISDNLDDPLGRYDLTVINADNVNNMGPYSELIAAYKLNHVIMVDQKGSHNAVEAMKKNSVDFVVIDSDLEADLAKVAPLPSSKLDSISAYDFVSELMKNKKQDLRTKTQVAKVFDQVLEKVRVKPEEVWKSAGPGS